MAIFRCTWCGELFDLSEQYDIEGLFFCGKCHSTYRDKLKPKPVRHPLDDMYKPDDYIQPTSTPKKKRK